MKPSNRADMSPAEYRNRLLIERRRVVRTVRNTLLVIAILAGLWWLYLISQNRRTYEPKPAADTPAAAETSAAETAMPQNPAAEQNQEGAQ